MPRYLAVFQRELREALLTPRALVVLAVATAFLALALLQGAHRVQGQAEAMALAEAANWKGWTAQEVQSPHAAAHYPMLLARPPAPLALLAEGVEGAMGGHLFTDAHRVVPVGGTAAGDAPIAGAVGSLDAAFVVAAVLSLLAVVWGADLVAGEKERGTLRLVFSNPVGRKAWLATKVAAHGLSFLALVLAAALVAGGLAWVFGGLPHGPGALWRLGGFAVASAGYLLAWLFVGVACSAFSSRVGPATMLALGLWVVFVVVVPRAMVAVAEAAWPPPPTAPAHMAMRVAEVELRREQEAMVAQAEARGELKGKSPIVQAEGTQAIRDAIDAKARGARAQAEAPMQAWREGMARRLEAWAYLSPAAAYLRATTAFAGTDASRQASFVAQAGAWREATLRYLNGLEESGVAEFKDYDRLARFQLQEAEPSGVWALAWGPVLGLWLLALGMLALALGRFARYDLR